MMPHTERFVRTVVALILVAALAASVFITNDAWRPSVVCNLITTALAIYVINVLVAARERRLKVRAQRMRHARRRARAAARKAALREFLGYESYWPILVCLSAGDDVLLAGKFGDLLTVRKVLKHKADEYHRQAGWLRHLTLLYSRYFTAKELSWLHRLERDLSALALNDNLDARVELEKLNIVSSLEGMEEASRALFKSFGLPLVEEHVEEFSGRVKELAEKWDVPGIRKRMGKELAPLFDAEHPDIAQKLREDDQESPPTHP
jgi:hypothetical protein